MWELLPGKNARLTMGTPANGTYTFLVHDLQKDMFLLREHAMLHLSRGCVGPFRKGAQSCIQCLP
jgi:hypothetical protein